jgi:hypothetical protein
MKALTRLALGIGALAVIAAAAVPTQAACPGAPGLNTISTESASYIYTEGWPHEGTTCFQFGCYEPHVANPSGAFWSLGEGSTVNNGTWGVADWLQQQNFGGTYFYYPGAFISTNWNESSGIAGCPFPPSGPDGTDCTCFLLGDQQGGVGYYALFGARMTTDGSTFFDQPGDAPIVLRPVPKPTVTNTVRNQSTFNLDQIEVTVSAGSGEYLKDGCACSNAHYVIRGQVLPRNTPAPTDRTTGSWPLLQLAGGGSQSSSGTPVGDPITLQSLCGGSNTDLWLTSELIFDSGRTSFTVSGNATKIECGQNLAEPIDRRTRGERPGARRDLQREGGR